LAEPGGIYISGKVHDETNRKLDPSFEDLGEQNLKNIVRPVRVYRVRGDTQLHQLDHAPAPVKLTVAVLPFENMSGDPEQRYFSDGITEDILTELSHFRQLFVVARNSTFKYRDRAVDIRSVARELGAQYVVEGSVRKAGNRARVTVQLIEGATGNHVWAERLDRDLQDIFAVQAELAQAIAARVSGQVERVSASDWSLSTPITCAPTTIFYATASCWPGIFALTMTGRGLISKLPFASILGWPKHMPSWGRFM